MTDPALHPYPCDCARHRHSAHEPGAVAALAPAAKRAIVTAVRSTSGTVAEVRHWLAHRGEDAAVRALDADPDGARRAVGAVCR